MKYLHASLLLSIAPVWGLPAGPPPVVDPVGPPGASGSLRGSKGLLGFDAGNDIPKEPSTVIPPDEFELAPGQELDPKLGFYLDLSNVKNPQPIRGETDHPTDPGPR
jgi:hypothetical protein